MEKMVIRWTIELFNAKIQPKIPQRRFMLLAFDAKSETNCYYGHVLLKETWD